MTAICKEIESDASSNANVCIAGNSVARWSLQVTLPADLRIAVKTAAAASDVTVTQFVEDALRVALQAAALRRALEEAAA